MWWVLLIAAAQAGDGPWTLSSRDQSVYVGVDTWTFSAFDGGEGDPVDLASPVVGAALTPIWTIGVRPGAEVELRVPIERARVLDQAACREAAPDEGWCQTSQGLGDVEGHLKVRLLDELYGSPVTLAINAGFRSGEAYADRRHRLTTLGDGQTDLGAGLSIGRTDVLGRGWYRLSVDGRYWRRLDAPDRPLPDEVAGAVAAIFTVHPSFSVGPAASGLFRLGGESLATADPAEADLWASLAARQVQVGGKLGVYGQGRGPTLSVTVLRTVLAQNNPVDEMVYSAGLGWFFRARPTEEER